MTILVPYRCRFLPKLYTKREGSKCLHTKTSIILGICEPPVLSIKHSIDLGDEQSSKGTNTSLTQLMAFAFAAIRSYLVSCASSSFSNNPPLQCNIKKKNKTTRAITLALLDLERHFALIIQK